MPPLSEAQGHPPKETGDQSKSGDRTSHPLLLPPHLMQQKPVLRRAGPLLPPVGTSHAMACSEAALGAVLVPASATLQEALVPPQSPLFPQKSHCPVRQRRSASAVTAPPRGTHSLALGWGTLNTLKTSPNHTKRLVVPTSRGCRRVLPRGWVCSQVTCPGGQQGGNKKGLGLHLPGPQRWGAPQSKTQQSSTKASVLLVIKNNRNLIFHLTNLPNTLGSHTLLVNMRER